DHSNGLCQTLGQILTQGVLEEFRGIVKVVSCGEVANVGGQEVLSLFAGYILDKLIRTGNILGSLGNFQNKAAAVNSVTIAGLVLGERNYAIVQVGSSFSQRRGISTGVYQHGHGTGSKG